MTKIEPFIRGFCPVCNKIIMDEKKTAYTQDGMEFFVLFSDNSRASFAICTSCFKTLTKEQVEHILSRQKVNWGVEIQKQMMWYSRIAIHLKVEKWAKTKEKLLGQAPGNNGPVKA